jgi:hypothetical protein
MKKRTPIEKLKLEAQSIKKEKLDVIKRQNYEQAAELRDKERTIISKLEKEKRKFEDYLKTSKRIVSNEIRRCNTTLEKEFGYKSPVDKKTNTEEIELPENSKLDIDWEIKITITNGKKKMKAKINLDDYIVAFGLHGVSLVDETIDILLKEIDKSVIKETKL